MAETGINYRLHMYNPDAISNISLPIVLAPGASESYCYLFPFKKVLRDTRINQLTFYISGIPGGMGTVEAKVCLYRCVGSLIDTYPGGGRIVAEKVTGTEVSVGATPLILKTTWQFTSPIDIQGGSYWIAIAVRAINNDTKNPLITTFTYVGITDADSNILYPKYDVTLATAMTLPSTINILALTRKTDYWFYASGEWY